MLLLLLMPFCKYLSLNFAACLIASDLRIIFSMSLRSSSVNVTVQLPYQYKGVLADHLLKESGNVIFPCNKSLPAGLPNSLSVAVKSKISSTIWKLMPTK